LQIVAAIKGITSGVFAAYAETFEKKTYSDAKLEALKAVLIADRAVLQTAIDFAKTQSGAYVDLIARQLVDSAMAILIGHYFLGQAESNANQQGDRKKKVAELFITNNTPVV
jgi:hypothetical protein